MNHDHHKYQSSQQTMHPIINSHESKYNNLPPQYQFSTNYPPQNYGLGPPFCNSFQHSNFPEANNIPPFIPGKIINQLYILFQ